jgi:hypothetical protein
MTALDRAILKSPPPFAGLAHAELDDIVATATAWPMGTAGTKPEAAEAA